jgi:hypothetical protein
MKNTVNIFEELNKMKNLIHVKRGTVISEQSDPFSCIKSRLDKENIEFTIQPSGSLTYEVGDDGDIWLFKTNKTWSQANPETQEIEFTGKWECTGDASYRIISNDNQQWLSSDKLGWVDIAETSSGGAKTELTARQKNINSNYCSVVNGKIEGANLAHKGQTFKWYVDTYKVTRQEVETAKQTCPNVVVPNPFAPVGPTPTQRFETSAKSLGVENPKMDVVTLQKILDTLNASSGAVTESKKSVNEELNTIKYLLGYQRGRVISEQDTATQSTPTPKDLITQIQTVLKDKFKQNLGPTGADGKWGNFSQTSLENALKTAAETKQKTDELSQRRAAETQQTATQDAAIQQAVDQGSQNIMNANLQLQPANTQGVQIPDLYTTLVNNKTLRTRNNGNIVYRGDDLTSAQRQELETKLKTMGYNLSTDQRDKTYGDKLVFKKNQ